MFRIVTLFPEFFKSPLETGLLGKAVERGVIKTEIIDLRDYSEDRYHRCDDYPYGGGSGMVFVPGPLFRVYDELDLKATHVILPAPSGRPLTQQRVKELVDKDDITIFCGHYEGIDQRFIDECVDEELSIGDYVISGGEYASLVILDAVARYVPGFMSNADSLREESFEDCLLEYPHYTRPADFRGLKVPEVLLSGNHGEIEKWRHEKRLEKTRKMRPDLYKRYIESNQKESHHGLNTTD